MAELEIFQRKMCPTGIEGAGPPLARNLLNLSPTVAAPPFDCAQGSLSCGSFKKLVKGGPAPATKTTSSLHHFSERLGFYSSPGTTGRLP